MIILLSIGFGLVCLVFVILIVEGIEGLLGLNYKTASEAKVVNWFKIVTGTFLLIAAFALL